MEQQTMTGSGLYIRKYPFLPAPAAVALCFGLLCLSESTLPAFLQLLQVQPFSVSS